MCPRSSCIQPDLQACCSDFFSYNVTCHSPLSTLHSPLHSPMVPAFLIPLLPAELPADLLQVQQHGRHHYCSMLHATSRSVRALRHAIDASLFCLLCAASVGASSEVINANLYVTDSPVSSAYGNNATAGDKLVANFAIRDTSTNATVGASLGFCVLLRDAGPNQCLYTIQFASGTIQVNHTVLLDILLWFQVFSNNVRTCKQQR